MPNTYFRFRQFTVHQEKTAMKVCTDACLFGAWVASKIKDHKIESVLDIGAGTGLLSLMIAQVSAARIDAVEVDESASQQAAGNFEQSPWSGRLHLHHADINFFDAPGKYDLIISNPPFFENDLLSGDVKRNLALHSTKLELAHLLKLSEGMMSEDGRLAVLIPYRRMKFFEEEILKTRLGIEAKVTVRQTEAHDWFRCMYLLNFTSDGKYSESEITIKSGDKYTEQFYSLVQDYYL